MGRPEDLAAGIEEKLEKLGDKVAEAFEGKDGMYSRLARAEEKIDQQGRIIWTLIGGVVTLVAGMIIQTVAFFLHH